MIQFAFLRRRTAYGVVTESDNYLDNVVGSNPGCVVTFCILAIPIATSTPFSGYRGIDVANLNAITSTE